MLGSAASLAQRAAYKEKFVGRAYTDQYIRINGVAVDFQRETLREIFQSDLCQGKKTLFEVGSGPTVWHSFLSSSRFNDIVLGDLVEDNLAELKKWLEKNEDASDWTYRAEQVAASEGHSDIKKGALEIQERTRSSVRKVVPCDVLERGVLPEDHRETFDVVLSCNCLETAAVDHQSYLSVVCNVGKLVKPGGLLVLAGFGGLEKTVAGTAEFLTANLTEDVVKRAVADAGFQMEVYRTKNIDRKGMEGVFGFVLAARKL